MFWEVEAPYYYALKLPGTNIPIYMQKRIGYFCIDIFNVCYMMIVQDNFVSICTKYVNIYVFIYENTYENVFIHINMNEREVL